MCMYVYIDMHMCVHASTYSQEAKTMAYACVHASRYSQEAKRMDLGRHLK